VDPLWQTVHEDGRVFPGEKHPAMVSLRTGQSSRDVIMGLHLPDGSQRWINVNAEPMFKSGQIRPYAVLTSFSDITKRREIEQVQSAGPVSANVRIESQVENKSISIGQIQAVPFGLLINELVTNALKYAFPEERKGLIQVTVQSPASEKVLLTVADDGVGLPAGLDPRHAEGLGLKLVCLLAKQLHGTVNFDRGQGTAVQILFNTLAEAEETTHE